MVARRYQQVIKTCCSCTGNIYTGIYTERGAGKLREGKGKAAAAEGSKALLQNAAL